MNKLNVRLHDSSELVIFASFRVEVAVQYGIVKQVEFLLPAVLLNSTGVVEGGGVLGQGRLSGQFVRVTDRRRVRSANSNHSVISV